MTNNNELSGISEQLKMPVVGRKYKAKFNRFFNDHILGNYAGEIKEGKDYEVSLIKNSEEIWIFEIWHNRKYYFNSRQFWNIFEELPDQDNEDGKKQLETEKKMQEEKPVSANNTQVEKAKEELKTKLMIEFRNSLVELEEAIGKVASQSVRVSLNKSFNSLVNYLTQNLLNALDESNIPEKSDCGITRCIKCNERERINDWEVCYSCFMGEAKPKSIWKPVSEWPEESDDTIFNLNGKYYLGKYYKNQTIQIPNFLIKNEELKNEISSFCTPTDFINEELRKLSKIDKLR